MTRGISRSRGQAADWIRAGAVRVNGTVHTKPAGRVPPEAVIDVDTDNAHVVGRGALKLSAALDAFAVDPRGRRALDAGASTGGFCQVLLERGASAVVALDVGHGQLASAVRADPRVTNLEGTNLRHLDTDVEWAPVDLIVADLSFISLTLVLPVLAALSTDAADVVVLVKPQFEAGQSALDSRGVVRCPHTRADAVRRVAQGGARVGLPAVGVARCAIAGGAGNQEYFLHLVARAHPQAGALVSPDLIYDRIVDDDMDSGRPDGHSPSGPVKGLAK